MKIFVKILGITGLALTLIPAFLVFARQLDLATNKNLMLLGMVLWFVSGGMSWKLGDGSRKSEERSDERRKSEDGR